LSNGKILLVDDESKITASLTRSFELEPWDIFTAKSAEEGLEMLARIVIDVVVSDEQLKAARSECPRYRYSMMPR